eukprot:5001063-Pyramimonas_sp.AAC.1
MMLTSWSSFGNAVGDPLGRAGSLLSHLEAILGVFERSVRVSGPTGSLLGPLSSVLGLSWAVRGRPWAVSAPSCGPVATIFGWPSWSVGKLNRQKR